MRQDGGLWREERLRSLPMRRWCTAEHAPSPATTIRARACSALLRRHLARHCGSFGTRHGIHAILAGSTDRQIAHVSVKTFQDQTATAFHFLTRNLVNTRESVSKRDADLRGRRAADRCCLCCPPAAAACCMNTFRVRPGGEMMRTALRHAFALAACCCLNGAASDPASGFCASFRPLPPSVLTHLEATVGQTVYRVPSVGPFVCV